MLGAYQAGSMIKVTRGTKAGAAQIRLQAAPSMSFRHIMSKCRITVPAGPVSWLEGWIRGTSVNGYSNASGLVVSSSGIICRGTAP